MYHIILNPTAGKKRALKNLFAVEKFLTERELAYTTHKTCAARDAENIARRLTESGEKNLIALGGDGTLHEILNGIVDPTQCNLGLIPSGTGNDFANRAGIPLDPTKAIALIVDGQPKATDYLEVGNRRCMNVGGMGMDVDVLERCKRGKFKGKLKYLFSLLHSLFSFKGLPVVIEREGETEKREALIAAACNGSQFGGGIPICPTAELDDNKVDVVVVDCIGGKIKIIKAFLKLMKGKILQYPATTHYLCDRVRFIPDAPCAMQLDGELYADLAFDVKICKGLQFFRP